MTDEILDAARTVFEQYGARRANVDDIARLAGISRSTLYRRFPTKDDLLAAVVTRELEGFFDELDQVAIDLSPQDAVVECFVRGLKIMQDIPVLGRLVQTEPEVITGMPDRPHMVLAQSERIVRTLRRSGATMSDDELGLAAELLLRIASTYLIEPVGHLDLDDEAAVREFARRSLSPLVR